MEQRKPTEISYMRKNRLKISFQKNIEIKVVSKEMGEVGGGGVLKTKGTKIVWKSRDNLKLYGARTNRGKNAKNLIEPKTPLKVIAL